MAFGGDRDGAGGRKVLSQNRSVNGSEDNFGLNGDESPQASHLQSSQFSFVNQDKVPPRLSLLDRKQILNIQSNT